MEIRPSSLFKYFSLNDRTIDSLRRGYLYGAAPIQLNDPFDCSLDFLGFGSIQDMVELELLDKHEVKGKDSQDRELLKLVRNRFQIQFFREWGIISMTDIPDSILMWSYYAGHDGICVEYDYSKFPFEYRGPFKVEYPSRIEEREVKSGFEAVKYLTTVKMQDWVNESEWRILGKVKEPLFLEVPGIPGLEKIGGVERKFYYPVTAVKSITLGRYFFDPYEDLQVSMVNDLYKIRCCLGVKRHILDFALIHEIPFFYMGVDREMQKLKREPVRIRPNDDHTGFDFVMGPP